MRQRLAVYTPLGIWHGAWAEYDNPCEPGDLLAREWQGYQRLPLQHGGGAFFSPRVLQQEAVLIVETDPAEAGDEAHETIWVLLAAQQPPEYTWVWTYLQDKSVVPAYWTPLGWRCVSGVMVTRWAPMEFPLPPFQPTAEG